MECGEGLDAIRKTRVHPRPEAIRGKQVPDHLPVVLVERACPVIERDVADRGDEIQ